MRIKSVFLSVFAAGAMALAADNGHAQSAPRASAPAASAMPAEWNQLVEKANKEGKLILFGQANTAYRNQVIAGFNKQYPKIKVEYRSGTKSSDLVSKIAAEKRAGVHEVDLVLWGSSTIYNELIPAGYVTPIKDQLILPELKDSRKWVNGQLEYSDKDAKYTASYAQFHGQLLLVNTKLVDTAKLLSYEDLFDPKYAGKIVVGHPKDLGQARYAFAYFYYLYGDSFFEKLAAQKPVVVRDVKQLIEWIAHGKYAIGISPGNAAAFRELVDAGVPVAGMVLKEGGYYSPGYNTISMAKDAPHPAAAKLFANWVFTKEGQEVMITALGGSSVRTDVSQPLKLEPGKKYYAPHLENNEEMQTKGTEAFNKYISK